LCSARSMSAIARSITSAGNSSSSSSRVEIVVSEFNVVLMNRIYEPRLELVDERPRQTSDASEAVPAITMMLGLAASPIRATGTSVAERVTESVETAQTGRMPARVRTACEHSNVPASARA
jgi:hypothetical protein